VAGLTAAQILRVWERGSALDRAERPLAVLAETAPEASHGALAALSIGRRDRRLLALRDATFGPRFHALGSCAQCGERLELTFSTADVQAEAEEVEPPGTLSLDEFALEIRLPDSTDLAATAECGTIAVARETLARRCIARAPESVPGELIPEIARRLQASDPGADITLQAFCPACRTSSELIFDIASFFWAEIEAEALRLFRDVHRIAQSYGWREAEILALTPLRRRAYLELLDQ
jgi:hypothetical protein